MILKDISPSPALREFVQCYRIVHFDFRLAAKSPFKAYPPRPEECLHFFILGSESVEFMDKPRKDYQLPVALVGQQTSTINRYLSQDLLNLTIAFQPAGLFRLTGTPSSELTNQYLDAENIFSNHIRLVQEQLQYAKTYDEMILVAEEFIGTLARKARKSINHLDAVSRQIIKSGGNLSLDWLSDESCLSTKQFTRKFKERGGINPKTYSRIVRFNRAYNMKNAYAHLDWLQIAIECGYVDYQHLAKDYKHFTGNTPAEFHLIESQSPERVLGLTQDLYTSRLSNLS